MPTYEYECKKCGHQFEVMQSIKDEPLKTCPKAECPEGTGRGRVQRLIGSGGGLLFKGSGFYITDYRSDSYKKEASKESAPEVSSTSVGSSTKSETKKTPDSPSKPAGSSTKGS